MTPLTAISRLLILGQAVNALSIPQRAASGKIARQDDEIESIISESPLLSLHRDLVEISSVTENEADVGEWLVAFLEEHKFSVQTMEVPVEGNSSLERWNVWATMEPDITPRVVLTTHMDVVAPHISYSAVYSNESDAREDILLQGRGSVDAKSCIAAMTMAAIELLEDGEVEPSDIGLLFVVNEEAGGDGIVAFSDSDMYADMYNDIEGFIFGEPTEGKLALGHKGGASLTLKANGTTAHSAYPWNGKSAVSMILPALVAVNELDSLSPEEGGLPGSEKYGNSTCNIGVVEAGTASNVVPGYAEAQAYIRVAGGEAEDFEKAIMARIELQNPDPELQVEFTFNNGPVDLVGDVEGFETIVLNYGTDIPRLNYSSEAKMYLFGPGSIEVAHGIDEFVRLGDLEKAVEDYKKLVADVLSG
jgi:acetylornithine deacetylase